MLMPKQLKKQIPKSCKRHHFCKAYCHDQPTPPPCPDCHCKDCQGPPPHSPNPLPSPQSPGATPSPAWVPSPTPSQWSPNPTSSPESHTPSPSPQGPTSSPSPTPVSLCKETLEAYSACGGIDTGSGDAQIPNSCCQDGFSCVRSNAHYWQCVPTTTPTPSPEGHTPSPTPWSPNPTPSPWGPSPTPPPMGDTPSPTSPKGHTPPPPLKNPTPSPSPTPVSSCKETLEAYSACGGINTGSGDAQISGSCCTDGFSCMRSNAYYWQCMPTTTPTPSPEGHTPSPTPWGPSPTPSPKSNTPSPTPWGPSPTPSPKSPTPSPSPTPVSSCKETLEAYSACGGINTGSGDAQIPGSCCQDGFSCVRSNAYYWQCMPTTTPTPSPEGYTPSPTPWGSSPTPSPQGHTPSPTPGGPSPTPSGSSPTPSGRPTPSGSSPTPQPTVTPTPVPTPAPVCIPGQGTWCLAPGYGAYVGVALDFNQYPTIANYSAAAGWNPASYNLYVNFPLKEGDKGLLNFVLPQIAALNAIALITVEPWGGLDSCTEQAAVELAELIHQYELQGLTVIIRFAHEMNGR